MNPQRFLPVLRSRIPEVNRFTAITRIQTLNEMISDCVAQPRFYATLLALLWRHRPHPGGAGDLQRDGLLGRVNAPHEIGVRMALRRTGDADTAPS